MIGDQCEDAPVDLGGLGNLPFALQTNGVLQRLVRFEPLATLVLFRGQVVPL